MSNNSIPTATADAKHVHICPHGCGAPLRARALADSDDRIHSSWLECTTCGWRNYYLGEARKNG